LAGPLWRAVRRERVPSCATRSTRGRADGDAGTDEGIADGDGVGAVGDGSRATSSSVGIADASVATTVRLPRLRDVPRALERSCDSTVS
jgi:hypothetical protein